MIDHELIQNNELQNQQKGFYFILSITKSLEKNTNDVGTQKLTFTSAQFFHSLKIRKKKQQNFVTVKTL